MSRVSPESNYTEIPPAVRAVIRKSALAFLHTELGVGLIAYQGYVTGVKIDMNAVEASAIAAGVAFIASLWHGVPAALTAAQERSLTRKLEVLAAIEAEVRKNLAANPVPAAPLVP